MKIKTKLIASYIVIAVISVVFSSYFAIDSVTGKYRKAEVEKLQESRRQIQAGFYNQMTELKRKTIIFTGLSEFYRNISSPAYLNTFFGTKDFMLQNTHLKIIGKNFSLLYEFRNSESESLAPRRIGEIPFFQERVDPYLRQAGIFRFDQGIAILVKAPIVDQDTFELQGYLLLEQPVNQFVGDLLKGRADAEIVIFSSKKSISTTFQDPQARSYFPDRERLASTGYPAEVRIQSQRYLVTRINITDFYGRRIGDIFVCRNIQHMLGLQKVFIRNFLLLALVTAVVLVFAGIYLARRLSRPLLNLSSSARKLARGDYDTRVEVTSSDEIGKLAQVFNEMVQSLRDQRQEILYLEQFFATIVENSPSGIIICDQDFTVVNINSEAERTFQVKKPRVVQRNLFEALPALDRFVDDFRYIYQNGITRFVDDFEYKRPDRESILRFAFYRISIQEKNFVVIQTEDITERTKIKERLVHADKLSSLGELLTKFVHEYNNLVAGITGNIELLQQQVKDRDLRERISKIKDLVLKSKNLSLNILNFSRKRKPVQEKIDMVQTAEEVIRLLESTALKNIEVQRQYEAEQIHHKIDREKISLVLFNLLLNARDAVEETTGSRKEIIITIGATRTEKGECLLIRVADNGVGIEKSRVDKIFERYYSTKKEKGTGLGLAIVKEIIEEYGGEVKLETEPGKGSRFSLLLPRENQQST